MGLLHEAHAPSREYFVVLGAAFSTKVAIVDKTFDCTGPVSANSRVRSCRQ